MPAFIDFIGKHVKPKPGIKTNTCFYHVITKDLRLVSNLMRMRVAKPSSALQAVAEVDDLEDEAVVDKAA